MSRCAVCYNHPRIPFQMWWPSKHPVSHFCIVARCSPKHCTLVVGTISLSPSIRICSKSNQGNQKYYLIHIVLSILSYFALAHAAFLFFVCPNLSIYIVIFSIYLSIYLSVSQSIYLSLYPFVYLSMYLRIYLSVCLSVAVCCLAGCLLAVCISVCLCLSVCLCVSLSLCLSVSVSIFLSIYLFLYTIIHGVPSHTKYRGLSHPILFLVCSDFFLS